MITQLVRNFSSKASTCVSSRYTMATARGALVSICHGAGPLPAMEDPCHTSLIHDLRQNVRKTLRLDSAQPPKAIALFTAHWQTQQPTISASEDTELYYDYYGFPEEGYSITYDGKGSPAVAQRAYELLQKGGFNAQLDTKRGWDHGTFVPMKLIYPEASIPIVQISVLRSQDPAELLRMGRALAPLRDEGVAMLGSGSPSYHDVRRWMSGLLDGDKGFAERQAEWHKALEAALNQADTEERTSALESWRAMPNSYEMHPRGAAEHFCTLLACAGAASENERVRCNKFDVMGAMEASFWWE